MRELSGRLRRSESERQTLAVKVDGLRAQVERLQDALEGGNVRRDNLKLREQLADRTDECARWRSSFFDAMYYLAVVSPPLAEIADDDCFQRWKTDVS